MNIQFSIIGLAIVMVFYLITAGALMLLGSRIRDKNLRRGIIVPVAVIALLLPWIDEVLTAWQFKEVCDGTGVQISKKIKVDGLLMGNSQPSSSRNAKPGLITDPGAILSMDRLGYRYTESFFEDGKVWHLERVEGGVLASVLDRPKAKYHFLTPITDADVGRAASCSEDIILDVETQETIAKYRYCKRYASLPERIWLGWVHRGPVEYCPSGDKAPKESLFQAVLIPVRP